MVLLRRKRSTAEAVARKVTDAAGSHAKGIAAAGVAVATAVGAAVLLRRRANEVPGATIFHVESDGKGAWLLRQDGSEAPIERYESKREAIAAAREHARKHNPSVLTIHREDGKVGRRHTYQER